MKKIYFIIAATLLFLSCQNEIIYKKGNTIYVNYPDHVNDEGRNITKKTCPILDFGDDEKEIGKVDAYFLNDSDEKNLIPYVDFADEFNGYAKLIGSPKLDLNENTATYCAQDSIGYTQKYIFNWKENTITLSSAALCAANFNSIVGDAKQLLLLPSYENRGDEVVFKLGDYGFDILFYDGKVLAPYVILYSFFNCAYEIFNGKEFVVRKDYSSFFATETRDDEQLKRFFGGNFSRECPQYFRDATFNALKFKFENFYGCKNYFGEDVLNERLEKYKSEILSTEPNIYANGFVKFLYSFGDLHNSHVSKFSLFYDDSVNLNRNASEIDKYNKYCADLAAIKKHKYGEGSYEDNDLYGHDVFKYSDTNETVVINIDEFFAGSDEDKGDLADGWKTSNYAAMRKAMKDIEDSHSSTVKNIVIDVTSSLGGENRALLMIMGFMTREPLYAVRDTIEDKVAVYKYKVDTNNDGKFDDDDGYPNYNWYVLSSNVSFSCGHLLPFISSFNGYAKSIGQRTAGGTCMLGNPSVLLDGTCYKHSSRFSSCGVRYAQKGNRVELEYSSPDAEGGYDPDIKIDVMDEAFYKDLANNVEKAINAAR